MAVAGGMALSAGAETARAAGEPRLQHWPEPYRPPSLVRLSDTTHELAARAIGGEHGRGMVRASFALDEAEVAGLSPDMRYATATMLVAERAPIRILPHERVVGSATLIEAPAHQTPVANVASTSHTTIGFARGLREGYRGVRGRIDERLARGDLDDEGRDFLKAMRLCLDAAGEWHRRHMEALDDLAARSRGGVRENYLEVREALARVPEEPPTSFREAVQSLWFMWAFQRLMGNWSGIGRIDEMLGPYLERDLAAGRITLDDARELVAHFWIKGCEWIGAFDARGSGDAQHYQNIILAGVAADGHDVTNEVTYLVLAVVEELHISDFPIAVRVSGRTPDRLLRRMAEVQKHGGGIVALYNEDLVIDGLVRFGYAIEEARTFANDGCWEAIIPGKTTFTYVPFDLLRLLHETLGLHTPASPAPDFADWDALYTAFLAKLRGYLDWHHAAADNWGKDGPPAPLISLLVDDCIERARSYYRRGSHYYVCAPHAGGMANVANSLEVIRRLVYEEKRVSLNEFADILRADWAGHEDLRQEILTRCPAYGNDDDAIDAMMARAFADYTDMVWETREREGVLRPAGISTFGREIEWSRPGGGRKASPDGHHEGEILATNFSPSPGTDRHGPTAVMRSYSKMDLRRTPNCATLELKVLPASVEGEAGTDALVGIMRSFARLGGMFLHIDVVDTAMLRDAQAHPDKYPNLSVRIAGWSARFATLNKDWQDMVIGRTQQRV